MSDIMEPIDGSHEVRHHINWCRAFSILVYCIIWMSDIMEPIDGSHEVRHCGDYLLLIYSFNYVSGIVDSIDDSHECKLSYKMVLNLFNNDT